MNERCIFCGTELSVLQRKKLSCGNTTQILCKDCYPKYEPFSAVERAEAALKTGRAEDSAELRKYLENVRNAQKKRAEERKAKADKRLSDMKCLRCDGRMLDCGPITFKLGEESLIFSDFVRLFTGSLTMNIFRCEKCGKVEFFSFNDTEFAKQFDE
jgi:hypothetical protein